MKALHKAALIGIVLALYSTAASAQLTNQGMLDQVVTEFATRASAWQTVVMNAAMFLFWTLGTISLVFTFGFMALRRVFRRVHPLHSVLRLLPLAAAQWPGLCRFDHPVTGPDRRTGIRGGIGDTLGHRGYRFHDPEAGPWKFVGLVTRG